MEKTKGLIILKKLGSKVVNPGLFKDDLAGELLIADKTEIYISRLEQTFGSIIERRESDKYIRIIVPLDRVGTSGFKNKEGFKVIKTIGLATKDTQTQTKSKNRGFKALQRGLEW